MPYSDAPALNDDGMLKDTMEIEWFDSPSDESHPIALGTRKHKRSDSSAQQTSDSEDDLYMGKQISFDKSHVMTTLPSILYITKVSQTASAMFSPECLPSSS